MKSIVDLLPRLTIEAKEDAKLPVTLDGLSIKLDGEEIKGLQGMTLTLEPLELNRATLEIAVGEVEVDAAVVQYLAAKVDTDDAEDS